MRFRYAPKGATIAQTCGACMPPFPFVYMYHCAFAVRLKAPRVPGGAALTCRLDIMIDARLAACVPTMCLKVPTLPREEQLHAALSLCFKHVLLHAFSQCAYRCKELLELRRIHAAHS